MSATPQLDDNNLSVQLKTRTKDVHRIVETKAIMRNLMKCQLPLNQYLHLLRGLTQIYIALEEALTKNASHAAVELIHFPAELARTATLLKDIETLSGGQMAHTCNCASVQSIVDRIRWIGDHEPHLLVAYSYVRYLGDLSGGQFLAKRVQKSFNLAPEMGSAFYAFDAITDIDHFKSVYKSRLDQVPAELHESIIQETIKAFEAHGPLFDQMDGVPCGTSHGCTILLPSMTQTLKNLGIGHSQLAMGFTLLLATLVYTH